MKIRNIKKKRAAALVLIEYGPMTAAGVTENCRKKTVCNNLGGALSHDNMFEVVGKQSLRTGRYAYRMVNVYDVNKEHPFIRYLMGEKVKKVW